MYTLTPRNLVIWIRLTAHKSRICNASNIEEPKERTEGKIVGWFRLPRTFMPTNTIFTSESLLRTEKREYAVPNGLRRGFLDIYDHCFPTNSLKYVVKLLLYPVARGQGRVILCYWVHISLDWAHNEVCGKSCVRWFLESTLLFGFSNVVLFLAPRAPQAI